MIKGFTVFKQELAGYLMQKGYPLIAAVPNRKKQGYLVFHFADSAELREEIEEYKRIMNEKKVYMEENYMSVV